MAAHVSGIKPQLQNVVATVNLGTKLDLKEIAMHARNAEYNPKVGSVGGQLVRAGTGRCGIATQPPPGPSHLPRRAAPLPPAALRRRHHAYPRTENNGAHLCLWQDGRHGERLLWNAGVQESIPANVGKLGAGTSGHRRDPQGL
jgi:hypothetical protein